MLYGAFFPIQYAGRGDLFEGLSIWQEISPNGEIPSDGDISPFGDYKYRKYRGISRSLYQICGCERKLFRVCAGIYL